MLVTASWGDANVAVEIDAESRSVDGLKRCLQEALPDVDVEAVHLQVCGCPVDDEAVRGLVAGSVIDLAAASAALAATTLREEGRDIDSSSFRGAVEAGDVRLCKLFLEAGVVWPPGVESPLHRAAWGNCRDLCELFLESGLCDKDAKGESGNTALHIAIFQKNVELAQLLLDWKCATDEQDNGGATPLHHAVALPCSPAVDVAQLAKLLLESGCNKDVKNNAGDTPLHRAAVRNDVQMAKLLLDSGCATDEKNKLGATPLHHAIHRSNIPLAKLLLASGCAKEVKDISGNTPLQLAILKKDQQMAKVLLDSGCAKNAGPRTLAACVLC